LENNLDNNLDDNEEHSSEEYDYMDDSMRNLYFNNSKDIDYTINTTKTQKKTVVKDKAVKHFSLLDFNKKTDKEQKDKMPKKFTSKRVDTKKKKNDNEENIPKRKFNPRLPPYNFVNRQKSVQTINIEDFPEL
jgi:hypothetical protein